MTTLDANPTAVTLHLCAAMASGVNAPWTCQCERQAYHDRCCVFDLRTKTMLTLARFVDDDGMFYVSLLMNAVEKNKGVTVHPFWENEWVRRLFRAVDINSLVREEIERDGVKFIEYRHQVGRVNFG